MRLPSISVIPQAQASEGTACSSDAYLTVSSTDRPRTTGVKNEVLSVLLGTSFGAHKTTYEKSTDKKKDGSACITIVEATLLGNSISAMVLSKSQCP